MLSRRPVAARISSGSFFVASELLSSGRRAALAALVLCCGAASGCGTFTRPAAEPPPVTSEQLVGVWVAWHDKMAEKLELRADGTYRFVLTGDGVADFSGRWAVDGGALNLDVDKFVDGNRERIGNRVRWTVEKFEGDNLVLGGLTGDTTYVRQPAK
jgi:hypothetical protein